ncbi:helix-turn-helix domain-containing protein [Gluconobacter sp. LMG 1744]|uniref:helix-turn-helix domain-containing protein n=1 Tax=Gluconobacter cadivus TaxID=2728101 RepID=UPI0018854233|nr:helix-turn-helix domain-containing protein [Gluconobacter cadivus]MBF0892172.1 helix-turn-helix domain-containing protein [Gluconobacter cadivus]
MTVTIVDILQALRRRKEPVAVAAFFEIPETAVHEVWDNLFECGIAAATVYPTEVTEPAAVKTSAPEGITELAAAKPRRKGDPPPTGRPKGGRPVPSHSSDPSKMSPLHQEMLRLLKEGRGTAEVSRMLNVTTATVSQRRRKFEDASLLPVSKFRKP